MIFYHFTIYEQNHKKKNELDCHGIIFYVYHILKSTHIKEINYLYLYSVTCLGCSKQGLLLYLASLFFSEMAPYTKK